MYFSKAFFSAFILAFALFSVTAFSQITIKGKILANDGKPLPLAQVHVANPADEKNPLTLNANPDGSYSIQTDSQDAVRLVFTGVYHNSYNFLLIPERGRKKPYELNINLSPIFKSDLLKPRLVVYTDDLPLNNKNGIEMTRRSDGTYSATVPNTRDTLVYQVLITNTYSGQQRYINGTQSDFFVYDGGGDYRSGIVTNKKEVEIVFDPSKFYDFKEFNGIITDDEYVRHTIDVRNKSQKISHNYDIEKSRFIVCDKWNKIDSIKSIYLDQFVDLYKSQKDSSARLIVALDLVKLAFDLQDINSVKNPEVKTIAAGLLRQVRPGSAIWSGDYFDLPFWTVMLAGEDLFHSEYLINVINQNPLEKVRQWAIYNLLGYAARINNQEKIDHYYDLLCMMFPGSNITENARIKYSKDKKIEVGRTIPDFSLASLDDPRQMITPASLKGKYVLIDIWGTWCMPCVMDIKYLDSAYTRFKDRNFTIFSLAVDSSPEKVQKFREGNYKMPWLHSFVEMSENNIAKNTFDVVRYPTTILIDPEGKIIATSNLRGEDLLKTLGEVLHAD